MKQSWIFISIFIALTNVSHSAGTIVWQQVGGSLGVDSGLHSIVDQGYTTPVQTDGVTTLQPGFLAHPLLVNQAPFVVSALPDLQLPVTFAPITISLDTVLTDIEGAVTYSVLVTGAGTSGSVLNNQLTLTGITGQEGISRVVVTANDGSFAISDTFAVTVQGTTALTSRKPSAPTVHELAVRLPKVFGQQADGSGRGEIGPTSNPDLEHQLTAELLLPSQGTVAVYVFDALGTPVIAWQHTVTASEFRNLEATADKRRILPIHWNLRAQNGSAVPPGVYLWKFAVQTNDGLKLETVKRLGVKGTKE